MLTIFISMIIIGCLLTIGGTVIIGLLLGSGLIVILTPIILDVLMTILILKFIFKKRKQQQIKSLRKEA